MNVLVTGGAVSGKSAFAEHLACELSSARIYCATMRADGEEAQRRIVRHRTQREGLGFVTVERASSLIGDERCGGAAAESCWGDTLDGPWSFGGTYRGVVLVEDLGNLVANALFCDDGQMADPASVLRRLESEVFELAGRCEHVVVVGNEVGCEGRSPYEGVRAWVRVLGALCCRIVARFDVVVEVSAGIPCVVKGELPGGDVA